ncbi:MAG: hypothetical protein IPF66_22475 [Holophagales bacterium]|nr:hypothetical protein [Holophagales bacterium]
MSLFGPGLEDAFRTAAAELGMCSASRLFVREASAAGTEALVELRDRLGRPFPVLDAVSAAALDGNPSHEPDPEPVLEALSGLRRILVVGFEADFLDALVPALPAHEVRIGLVRTATLEADWTRLADNYAGRLELVEMPALASWAGSKSGLMTLVYGVEGEVTHVAPAWLRVAGDDVRPIFRELVGWDVLGRPMGLYPRWLTEVPAGTFTRLV